MKPRVVLMMVLIVLMPLVLLTWAALRIADSESTAVQRRFRSLMEDRLRDTNLIIGRFFDNIERQMQQVTSMERMEVDELRETIRSEPKILQLFVLSDKGQLIYPDPTQTLNSSEQSFLLSTSKMFTGQDLRDAVLQQESNSDQARPDLLRNRAPTPHASQLPSATLSDPASQRPTAQSTIASDETRPDAARGWFVWYWDRGLNLIYWQRHSSGRIIGAALERGRWIADLIAELPDTSQDEIATNSASQSNSIDTRIRLTNASGETIYQWGSYEPNQSEPFCEIPVAAPLQSWRLQCFLAQDTIQSQGHIAQTGLITGLIAVALTLATMAWVLFRDYSLAMCEAKEQVSFVNQVSHELKTPLTNIRLYAELLEKDLSSLPDEDSQRPTQRLEVILFESQRLSRLIGNVLTLARQKRRTLQPQFQEHVPDELIRQTIDRFRPSLEPIGIKLELDLHAERPMQLDADFLEQILVNLISNVEKYASSGKWMRVASCQMNGTLEIVVEDAGPGIPPSKWKEVFRPFSRMSRSVSAASGTGIGLSIARELARLHGGDIQIERSRTGSRFRVRLQSEG